MKARTKRKIAVAGSTLTLVSTLAVGFTAVGGAQGPTRSSVAAASGNGVRAQYAGLNADPSAFPSVGDTSDSPPVSTDALDQGIARDLTFTIRVKNFGAFVGYVCMPEAKENYCTGDIPVLQEKELTYQFSSLPDPEGYTTIHGQADGGSGADVRVPPGTHCFRFDGTTLAGFSFQEVSCHDF